MTAYRGRPILEVLYEDNHLLAVNKPAGLATMGGTGRADNLFAQAQAYLKERYHKPGNVYLGIVSRLDAAVSGVVLFARTSKAAARLAEQFRTRSVEKTYWAIVEGAIEAAGPVSCVDWLIKDERSPRMRPARPGEVGAKEARMSYRRLRAAQGGNLVEVKLETGRKHQIRAQLAARGHAILGDRKYGSRRGFPGGIALHSRRLAFTHPTRRARMEIEAPPPACWRAYLG